jgi:hypothetical protein
MERVAQKNSQRRSERVLLQIRVLVETETEEGDRVRLEAFTLVVNAHGGLLEMSLKVPKGHRMSLSNPTLGVRESCRVIASRSSQGGVFAIAFEFDSPAPQFWPIVFPPIDWSLVKAED